MWMVTRAQINVGLDDVHGKVDTAVAINQVRQTDRGIVVEKGRQSDSKREKEPER